jgi:hypothetical protein
MAFMLGKSPLMEHLANKPFVSVAGDGATLSIARLAA